MKITKKIGITNKNPNFTNSALPVQTTCFYVSPTDKGLDRLSDGSFLFCIIIVVLLMYFFWCTKYLINAPLGELKKKICLDYITKFLIGRIMCLSTSSVYQRQKI